MFVIIIVIKLCYLFKIMEAAISFRPIENMVFHITENGVRSVFGSSKKGEKPSTWLGEVRG